jgi:hypothetical protein
MTAFKTAITLCGSLRKPHQMLQKQTYEGHVSIHDDNMANDLGFSGAPIEGPTHFSQFDPLLFELFGKAWFETGCIGPNHPESELDRRRARLRPSQQLVILAEQYIGMKGKQDEHVVMDFDQHMGDMYPFSLNEKIEKIT